MKSIHDFIALIGNTINESILNPELDAMEGGKWDAGINVERNIVVSKTHLEDTTTVYSSEVVDALTVVARFGNKKAEIRGLITKMGLTNIFVREEDIFVKYDETGMKIGLISCTTMEDIIAFRENLSETMKAMEVEHNIFILPVFKNGANFKAPNGAKWKKFVAIDATGFDVLGGNKAFEECFIATFTRAFGIKPEDKIVKDMPKSMLYLCSNIREEINFKAKVMVVPESCFKDPFVMDGVGYYFPKANKKRRWDVKINGKQVTLGLDGNTFQIRGIAGWLGKGTMMAGDYKFFLGELNSFEKDYPAIKKHVLDGGIVMTTATLKGAPEGQIIDTHFYYHNDARTTNGVSGFAPVKLVFDQSARKMLHTSTDGAISDINSQVKELNVALTEVTSLCQYVTGSKDLIAELNEKAGNEIHGRTIVDGFKQVAEGARPFGMAKSDKQNLLDAMPRLIKRTGEVHVGGKFISKDFTWENPENNGIGIREYIACRSTLKDGEITINAAAFKELKQVFPNNIVKEEFNEVIVLPDDINAIVQRMPITLTSVRKFTRIIGREDFFNKVEISVQVAKDLGADFDGDKTQIAIFKKSLYDFQEISHVTIQDMLAGKVDDARLAKLLAKFDIRRPAGSADIEKRFNQNMELDNSNMIGVAEVGIGRIIYLALIGKLDGRPVDFYTAMALAYQLEIGFLAAVIDGKKHSAESVPFVGAFSELINSVMMEYDKDIKAFVGLVPEFFGIAGAKEKFGDSIVSTIRRYVERFNIDSELHKSKYVFHNTMAKAFAANLPTEIKGLGGMLRHDYLNNTRSSNLAKIESEILNWMFKNDASIKTAVGKYGYSEVIQHANVKGKNISVPFKFGDVIPTDKTSNSLVTRYLVSTGGNFTYPVMIPSSCLETQNLQTVSDGIVKSCKGGMLPEGFSPLTWTMAIKDMEKAIDADMLKIAQAKANALMFQYQCALCCMALRRLSKEGNSTWSWIFAKVDVNIMRYFFAKINGEVIDFDLFFKKQLEEEAKKAAEAEAESEAEKAKAAFESLTSEEV